MSWRAIAVILALGFLPWTAGCSFLMQRAPATLDPPTAPLHCTRSRAAPVADLLLGLGASVVAVAAVVEGQKRCAPDQLVCGTGPSPGQVAVPFLILGATALGASAVGFSAAGRCEDVTWRQDLCLRGDEAVCRSLAAGSSTLPRRDRSAGEPAAPPTPSWP